MKGLILYYPGGGAIRPLPREGRGGLYGNLTVGPRPKVWTRNQRQKQSGSEIKDIYLRYMICVLFRHSCTIII